MKGQIEHPVSRMVMSLARVKGGLAPGNVVVMNVALRGKCYRDLSVILMELCY